MKKSKLISKQKIVILSIGTFLLVAVLGVLVYAKTHKKTVVTPGAKTTSTAPSAQENFTNGGSKPPVTESTNNGNAAVSDTNGQQATAPDKSLWSTSTTGEITAYTPVKDKMLTNGDVVSGESKLTVVNYRVLDDVSGMIAQGQLKVVNGKFSGTLSFTTKAATGRLDLYGTTDIGKEFGNVEIPVRFK